MNTRMKKWIRALAITAVALQIPMLMLWKITVETVISCSCGLEVYTDSAGGMAYELTFQWEKLGGVLLHFLPILLSLAACLILSVLGLVSVLRQKRVTVPTLCFYAVTVLVCGFLWAAFARPSAIVGLDNGFNLETQEYMFYRYFAGMEWDVLDVYPLLECIKFLLLGLLMAVSGALCALGITAQVRRRRPQPVPETEPMEPALHPIQGRRGE